MDNSDKTEQSIISKAAEVTVPSILGGAVFSSKDIAKELVTDGSKLAIDGVETAYSAGKTVVSKSRGKIEEGFDKNKTSIRSTRVNKKWIASSEKARTAAIEGKMISKLTKRETKDVHLGKTAKGISRAGKKVSAVIGASTVPAKTAIKEYSKMQKISEVLNKKDVSEVISLVGKSSFNKACSIVFSMIKHIFLSAIKIFTSLLAVLLPYMLLVITPVIIVICIYSSVWNNNSSSEYSAVSDMEEVSEVDISLASSLMDYNFIWPVDLSGYQCLTSRFGYRQAPTAGASSAHQGVDIACRDKTPIYAAADGIISYAGWTSGGGYTVTINHGKDAEGKTVETTYMHNSILKVKAGVKVKQGQMIALAGSTGISTGTHCHMNVVVDGTHYNALYAYDADNLKAKRNGKIVTEAITIDYSYYKYLYYDGNYIEASKVKSDVRVTESKKAEEKEE